MELVSVDLLANNGKWCSQSNSGSSRTISRCDNVHSNISFCRHHFWLVNNWKVWHLSNLITPKYDSLCWRDDNILGSQEIPQKTQCRIFEVYSCLKLRLIPNPDRYAECFLFCEYRSATSTVVCSFLVSHVFCHPNNDIDNSFPNLSEDINIVKSDDIAKPDQFAHSWKDWISWKSWTCVFHCAKPGSSENIVKLEGSENTNGIVGTVQKTRFSIFCKEIHS